MTACIFEHKETTSILMRDEGTWMAQSGEHVALDLRDVSSNPMLSVEIT